MGQMRPDGSVYDIPPGNEEVVDQILKPRYVFVELLATIPNQQLSIVTWHPLTVVTCRLAGRCFKVAEQRRIIWRRLRRQRSKRPALMAVRPLLVMDQEFWRRPRGPSFHVGFR